MNRVVRVNATDKRIAYVGPWTMDEDNSMSVITVQSYFFLMFRGSIHI